MGCVLGKGEGDAEGEGEAYAPPSPPLEPPAPRLKSRLGEGDSIYLALGQSTGPGAHAPSPPTSPSASATSPASSPASSAAPSTAAASSAPPPPPARARARPPPKCTPTSSICNTYFSTPCSSATFTSLTSSAVSSAATSADPSEAECVRWPSRVCKEHGNPCVALSRRCRPCKRRRGRGRGKPRKGECRGVCKYYPPGRDIIYHPQAAPCFAQARYAQYRCLDWMRGCIRCVNGQMMTCVNNMAPGGQLSCVCRPCCPGAFGCSDFGCCAPRFCHRC